MRNLSLKKETLAQLTDDELGDIAGASFRTKYECTESYQVCNPVSVKVCLAKTPLCPTTPATPLM